MNIIIFSQCQVYLNILFITAISFIPFGAADCRQGSRHSEKASSSQFIIDHEIFLLGKRIIFSRFCIDPSSSQLFKLYFESTFYCFCWRFYTDSCASKITCVQFGCFWKETGNYRVGRQFQKFKNKYRFVYLYSQMFDFI